MEMSIVFAQVEVDLLWAYSTETDVGGDTTSNIKSQQSLRQMWYHVCLVHVCGTFSQIVRKTRDILLILI